jgi:hypothetical protein
MLLSHPYAKHKSHSIETSVEKHEKAWWKVRGGLLAAAADLTNQRENLYVVKDTRACSDLRELVVVASGTKKTWGLLNCSPEQTLGRRSVAHREPSHHDTIAGKITSLTPALSFSKCSTC